jgi:hypothetical protein
VGNSLKRLCVDYLIIITTICALCVQDGWTPLHCACFGGHAECAKLLLQAGADADKVTEVNHNLHTGASSLFLSVVCIVCHCPSMSVPGQ